MRISLWVTLITIGMLFSTAGLAEDAEPIRAVEDTLPEVVLPVAAVHSHLSYAPQWRSYYPLDSAVYTDDRPEPFAEVDFRDSSIVARAGKLRGLSLLTLAEFRHTRLYLGVNDDGLVGLHFNAAPFQADERYLELVRMPYLDTEVDSDQPTINAVN